MSSGSSASTVAAVSLSTTELAAWRGFLRAHARIAGELDAQLREEHGLALSSYEVLMLLGEAPGGRMRISELSAATLLSMSGASRLVDRLVKTGLVAKEACAEDGRGAQARLTTAGRERLAPARVTHLAGVREAFLSRLDADDLEALARAWERVNGAPEVDPQPG